MLVYVFTTPTSNVTYNTCKYVKICRLRLLWTCLSMLYFCFIFYIRTQTLVFEVCCNFMQTQYEHGCISLSKFVNHVYQYRDIWYLNVCLSSPCMCLPKQISACLFACFTGCVQEVVYWSASPPLTVRGKDRMPFYLLLTFSALRFLFCFPISVFFFLVLNSWTLASQWFLPLYITNITRKLRILRNCK